jgi:hypothetical protein
VAHHNEEARKHIDKGSYWLKPDSASLTRVIDRDDMGIATEQTICAFSKWDYFVDRGGNVCEVPLSNGRMPSSEPEAERYEIHVVREQVLNGCLPLEECPHTTRYQHIMGAVNGGALVKPPAGYKPCQGKKRPTDLPPNVEFFGCEHMQAVIEKRRDAALKKWQAMEQATDADIKKYEAMAKAITKEQQAVQAGIDPRANLRTGKGES